MSWSFDRVDRACLCACTSGRLCFRLGGQCRSPLMTADEVAQREPPSLTLAPQKPSLFISVYCCFFSCCLNFETGSHHVPQASHELADILPLQKPFTVLPTMNKVFFRLRGVLQQKTAFLSFSLTLILKGRSSLVAGAQSQFKNSPASVGNISALQLLGRLLALHAGREFEPHHCLNPTLWLRLMPVH